MLALFFPFHERFVSQVNDNVLFEYVRYREYIRFDDDENPLQREISLFRRSENRWRVGERSEDRFNKDDVGVGKWFRVGKERICRRKRGRGGGEVAVPNSALFYLHAEFANYICTYPRLPETIWPHKHN